MINRSQKFYKYLYGPVYSWRLGMSLGIDPLTHREKICNLDCIYCQLGRSSAVSTQRDIFVPTQDIIDEINRFPSFELDYLTFSGRGEPTLAQNLGEMISAIRKIRSEKIAVITNSVLMDQEDVREDLKNADCVVAKLDASCDMLFRDVNKAPLGIDLESVLEGLAAFRGSYSGKFALQIMFMKENASFVREIAEIAMKLKPDEIQLNTPLRPSDVKPLSREEMEALKHFFNGPPIITVFDKEQKAIEPINLKQTIRRHGRFKKFL